jgi:pimeloyl-ACP methyl ester carboxylesterase
MEMELEVQDDNLERFEADGATLSANSKDQGYVEHCGARLWYTVYGTGTPVILLHGGLGHSGNWAKQVPSLVNSGYQVILMDSRGHGRSTRDKQPFSYELMAGDVLALMDALHLERCSLVGWSDGACTALVLAASAPSRIAGVFFFACNMDPGGVKPFEATATLNRCFSRHAKDYAQLSAVPERFEDLVADLTLMQKSQPNYSAEDLAKISVPVTIVQSEHDEFIRQEHAEYLAQSIPRAEFVFLNGVSHFAPLQRPGQFNAAILSFLARVLANDRTVSFGNRIL